MKKITIDCSDIQAIRQGIYTYTMKWSDNPYTMIFESKNWYDVASVKDTLESRMNEYLNGKTNKFITSDINGLDYIKVLDNA